MSWWGTRWGDASRNCYVLQSYFYDFIRLYLGFVGSPCFADGLRRCRKITSHYWCATHMLKMRSYVCFFIFNVASTTMVIISDRTRNFSSSGNRRFSKFASRRWSLAALIAGRKHWKSRKSAYGSRTKWFGILRSNWKTRNNEENKIFKIFANTNVTVVFVKYELFCNSNT